MEAKREPTIRCKQKREPTATRIHAAREETKASMQVLQTRHGTHACGSRLLSSTGKGSDLTRFQNNVDRHATDLTVCKDSTGAFLSLCCLLAPC
jgi:hypothetical protein